tara:strand:- start:9647 stop:10036 length:390 start_codon:yes stop_codon:yes gene_type:complete
MKPNWMVIGALSGALGVAFAAWGAHGMETVILEPKRQTWWLDGVRLQMWHAPILCLVGWIAGSGTPQGGRAQLSGWFLALGSLIFSGSLYAMALGGPSILGAITPLGGLSLILGWVVLALTARPTASGT